MPVFLPSGQLSGSSCQTQVLVIRDFATTCILNKIINAPCGTLKLLLALGVAKYIKSYKIHFVVQYATDYCPLEHDNYKTISAHLGSPISCYINNLHGAFIFLLSVHVHVSTIMQYLCIVHVYMYTCKCVHYTAIHITCIHVCTCRNVAIHINRPSGISQAAAIAISRTKGVKVMK